MSSIKILDPLLISKIAAGEVIERPASVVKELLENAIDAGSTEITITIKEGGKDLIEIRDNGKGISSEDLPLAVKRHSTSKISKEEDLSNIITMGFRGEALYSIASVSRFSIISRTSNEDIATKIGVMGDVDNIKVSEEVLGSPGTIIRVQDLFFNFIVRRKFMKKAYIEQGYIHDVIAQYAVAHPQISLIFNADGKEEIRTIRSNDHLIPIRKIFGAELVQTLLNLGIVGRENITIEGYISKPGNHKRNRKYQFFYLNGRSLFSKLLQESVEEGYGSYLMKSEFPCVFIFMEINPKEFDINIHPQKREALFFDEKKIQNALSSAITHCIKTHDIVPKFTPSSIKKRHTKLDYSTDPSVSSISTSKNKIRTSSQIKLVSDIHPSEIGFSYQKDSQHSRKELIHKNDTLDLIGADVKYRGPLSKEFILLEDMSTNDLIVLDFHASHERVNLERLMHLQKIGKIPVQTLLQPYEIQSKYIDTQFVSSLTRLGFDIRIPRNNDDTFEIHAIPKIIAHKDITIFFELLTEKVNSSIYDDEITKIISVVACHASYRSGETLSFQQTKDLLTQLAKTENPNICAHGRPTFFRIAHQEMLKQVRRI
jgi:DNA mismatch repair protein MutL